MKTSMGVNLVWSLFSGKPLWWKQVICKKSFRGSRFCCLEFPPDLIKDPDLDYFRHEMRAEI
jgi:hypothetical protein